MVEKGIPDIGRRWGKCMHGTESEFYNPVKGRKNQIQKQKNIRFLSIKKNKLKQISLYSL